MFGISISSRSCSFVNRELRNFSRAEHGSIRNSVFRSRGGNFCGVYIYTIKNRMEEFWRYYKKIRNRVDARIDPLIYFYLAINSRYYSVLLRLVIHCVCRYSFLFGNTVKVQPRYLLLTLRPFSHACCLRLIFPDQLSYFPRK